MGVYCICDRCADADLALWREFCASRVLLTRSSLRLLPALSLLSSSTSYCVLSHLAISVLVEVCESDWCNILA
ncbi:hypothetical protein OH77DRAFT_373676 [Trametes cingulata]|nr:hypothetical protein OH77DRAFT_373676 [Trametes cingulata]